MQILKRVHVSLALGIHVWELFTDICNPVTAGVGRKTHSASFVRTLNKSHGNRVPEHKKLQELGTEPMSGANGTTSSHIL